MKSIPFQEATNKIAETQDEFNTVHSQFQHSDQSVNLCFEFDDQEIEEIKKTKKIWYKQQIGRGAMQPMNLSVYKEGMIKDPINNIDMSTIEGRFLLSALAVLTTDNFPDKTPQEVLEILREQADKMK